MTTPLESRPVPDFYYFSDRKNKIRVHSCWVNTRGRVYSAIRDKILALNYDDNDMLVLNYMMEKKIR